MCERHKLIPLTSCVSSPGSPGHLPDALHTARTGVCLQASREAAAGDVTSAMEHMEKCVTALLITHGAEHVLTRRVVETQKNLRNQPSKFRAAGR